MSSSNHEFDLDKVMAKGGRCRTRNGLRARILCVDLAGDPRTIVAAVREGDSEHIRLYFPDGRHDTDSKLDLMNIPDRHVRWVNFYAPAEGAGKYAVHHSSKDRADRHAGYDRIACIRVEFEEGEGL